MNYIYDIYLNFNSELYDFFEWNKTDKLTHIKSIPIIKVTEDIIKTLITNDIKLNENSFNTIKNKAMVWNKQKKDKNYVLFCDKTNVIAIEFSNAGKSINKSYLQISDELEILENIKKYKEIHFEFETLNKKKQFLKTRKEKKDDKFIKNELNNINNEKLQYIFFECFGKYEKDSNIIIKKLLNLSKNSKTYNNLYNILKITSTTIK